MSNALDELLAASARYAASFGDQGKQPLPPPAASPSSPHRRPTRPSQMRRPRAPRPPGLQRILQPGQADQTINESSFVAAAEYCADKHAAAPKLRRPAKFTHDATNLGTCVGMGQIGQVLDDA